MATKKTTKFGLQSYVGKIVVLYCSRYIYTGTLVSIDKFSVALKGACIVFDTGEHTDKAWALVEPCIDTIWNVSLASIESFGLSNK